MPRKNRQFEPEKLDDSYHSTSSFFPPLFPFPSVVIVEYPENPNGSYIYFYRRSVCLKGGS